MLLLSGQEQLSAEEPVRPRTAPPLWNDSVYSFCLTFLHAKHELFIYNWLDKAAHYYEHHKRCFLCAVAAAVAAAAG